MIVTPAIYPDCVAIDPAFERNVRKTLAAALGSEYDASLAHGGFAICGSYHAHAQHGVIHDHEDGAGITYGLVIIADGDHILCVGDKRLPLQPGTAFVIDSDATHRTESGTGTAGLIAFITLDFFHHPPYKGDDGLRHRDQVEPWVSIDEFAIDAHFEMSAYLEDGIDITGLRNQVVAEEKLR